MGRQNHGQTMSSNLIYYNQEARLSYQKEEQEKYERRKRTHEDYVAAREGRPTSKDITEKALRDAEYQKRKADALRKHLGR